MVTSFVLGWRNRTNVGELVTSSRTTWLHHIDACRDERVLIVLTESDQLLARFNS